jgi:hypothetical protein
VWLERHNVEDVASKLGIAVTPIVGRGTLPEAVEFARQGFVSTVSQRPDFKAEGLVMRPAVELRTRRGDRVITKIKHRDFVHK